jgi:hypothetical protein
MARTALTIVGGVVGAFFGMPGLGMAAGSLVGNLVDPEVIQGPRIGETGVQTSAEGAPRAIIYGTASVTGNIIQSGRLVKGDVISGGKGGEAKQSNEICIRTYAIRICEGPIAGVLRIWEDDKLVYDRRAGSTMLAESDKWIFGCGIYLGTEDQMPDPFLMTQAGPEPFGAAPDTPAYRGTAYMVFVGRDLTDRRGSIPQYRFEVSTTTKAVTPSSQWFDYVSVPGTGTVSAFESLDLSEGGLVWIVRQDATEPVRMYFKVDADGDVYEMGNSNVVAGTPDNPVVSTAVFYANGVIYLPTSTLGGTYMAYVFKKSLGNFDIQTYTGSGSAGHAIGHSLGSAPKMHFVRQLDDVSNTLSFTHLEQFGGLAFLLLGSQNNVSTSSQQWNNTAPTSVDVTLGSHSQINGSGKQYIMFLFGGDDCFSDSSAAGTDLNLGFEPTFSFAKRRGSGSDSFPYNLITGASAPGFAGMENMSYGSGNGGIAYTEERISNLSDGVCEFNATGDWSTTGVDSFFIRGSTAPATTDLTLGEIVADIHDRCGIPSSRYDVSELTDIVSGIPLAGDYNGGDAIDTARAQYFFDKAEYDKKLWYPKRGKAVAGSITIDDLIEVPDLSRREQAVEFPKKLHLQYQHAASGYPTVKATSQRSSPDVRVVGEVTMQTPFVINEDQAAQSASKRHKVAFAEAEGELVISVPDSLIKYVPSDVLAVTLRGRTSRERLEKMEYADGVIKWTLRKDRQSAYTSNLTGVPIPLPTAPPPTIVGDTVLIVADISGRQDAEDDLNYLVAVSGTMPAWYGAAVQRSLDGGASFTNVVSINSAARIGTLLDAIPAASEHYTDTTNVVRVQLYRDTQEIGGITDAQFRSEGGAFLLEKADGTFEVCQGRDAVNEGGGIFAISTLNRGRLNSGAAAHLVGAKFVMLEDMTHVPAQSAWIGQTLTHRGVSFDQAQELAIEQSVVFAGRSQIEWPVASFTLSRSGNNVTTTWAPRHRFGSDDSPLASINFQGYRLTFVGTSTVTFDQTAPTSTYDVSAIGGAVTVGVASINRITGAGPATSGAI